MKTIGIFKLECPTGWTPLSAWDDKFLLGTDNVMEAGDTGGSETHIHSVNMPSYLMHFTHYNIQKPGNNRYGAENFSHYYNHNHLVDAPPNNTDPVQHLPEYIDVAFCYKED